MRRLNSCIIVVFLLSSVIVNASSAAAQNKNITYPKLISWVNDDVGLLKQEQREELDARLKAFEGTNTSQIFVGIMDKLPGDISLEDYALELFNHHWQPGQKGVNNGVILLVFIADRKLRISVGDGFEQILTDTICKDIIVNEITPSFQQGNYYQGIKNGIERMMNIIHKEWNQSHD